MSTIGYENWAVDLAEVGPIYPFQGSEVIMVVIGVLFWLGWHRMQFVVESRELEEMHKHNAREDIDKAIDRY